MWTIKILNKFKENGRVRIQVEFSNGSDIVLYDYFIDNANQNQDWLNEQINNKVNQLTELYSMADELTIGEINLSTLASKVATKEMFLKDEVIISEQDQFVNDYQKLLKAQKAVDMGLIPESSMTDLRTKVQNEYKEEYLNLL